MPKANATFGVRRRHAEKQETTDGWPKTVKEIAELVGRSCGHVRRQLSRQFSGVIGDDGLCRYREGAVRSFWTTCPATTKGGERPPAKKEPDEPMVLSLKDELAVTQRQVKKLTKDLGNFERITEAIASNCRRLPVEKFKAVRFPGLKAQKDAEMLLELGDWHIGQQINPVEVFDGNTYNYATACRRLEYLQHKLAAFTRSHRPQYTLDKLHVVLLGDFVNGIIHQEFLETDEFPITEQVVRAGKLLAVTINQLTLLAKNVHVYAVRADNHGRVQLKPRAKGKDLNNWNHVVYAITENMLNPKVCSFHVSPGMNALYKIAGWNFLVQHGDEIRAWGARFPMYGWDTYLGLESRRRGRVTSKEPNYDYALAGHWHTAQVLDGRLFMNGALTGTSEFEHARARETIPSQVSFLVSPKHGPFNWTPWNLREAG